MMKFLGKQSNKQLDTIRWEDFLEPGVFISLLPSYQNLLKKINATHSHALDKLVTKINSNHIQLNNDMLSKILEHLTYQNTLPIHGINSKSKELIHEIFDNQIEYQPHFWTSLLKNLGIWENQIIDAENIFLIFEMTHQFLIEDRSPAFLIQNNHETRSIFWKKKYQENINSPLLAVFKYIYEKFKFFHWDLLPNTKRPMDLYELYCLIDDAFTEKNLISMSSEHIEFHRSLNASALLFSVMHFFPAALPDYIAIELQELKNTNQISDSFFQDYNDLLNCNSYVPLFGNHPLLMNYNMYSNLICFKTIIKEWLQQNKLFITLQSNDNHSEIIEHLLVKFTQQTDFNNEVVYLDNISKRLNFIFNRLTAAGFLLRSPILKGLGYQPLINIEIPNKFAQNLNFFIKNFNNLTKEKQILLLQFILFEIQKSSKKTHINQNYSDFSDNLNPLPLSYR